MPQLTKEEARAIATLKRLSKKWPDNLWLFSASGTLLVMKKLNGRISLDQECAVDRIDIPNDGGDF